MDIDRIKNELSQLNMEELDAVVQFVKDKKLLNDYTSILLDALEAKYHDAFTCPKCGTMRIMKNGHYKNGRQRWICSECHSTFASTKNTILENTKLSPVIWLKYMIVMAEDKSLRECANYAGVSLKGSFYMRHKILNAMAHKMQEVELEGIVELDEMSETISYSGNHKKQNKSKELPQKSVS